MVASIKAAEAEALVKREECRDLAKEIRKFFTNDQIVMIIKLLALELESNEATNGVYAALEHCNCASLEIKYDPRDEQNGKNSSEQN